MRYGLQSPLSQMFPVAHGEYHMKEMCVYMYYTIDVESVFAFILIIYRFLCIAFWDSLLLVICSYGTSCLLHFFEFKMAEIALEPLILGVISHSSDVWLSLMDHLSILIKVWLHLLCVSSPYWLNALSTSDSHSSCSVWYSMLCIMHASRWKDLSHWISHHNLDYSTCYTLIFNSVWFIGLNLVYPPMIWGELN